MQYDDFADELMYQRMNGIGLEEVLLIDEESPVPVKREAVVQRAKTSEWQRFFFILLAAGLFGYTTFVLFAWLADTVRGSNPALGVVLMGMAGSGLAYAITRGVQFAWRHTLRPLLFTTVAITVFLLLYSYVYTATRLAFMLS